MAACEKNIPIICPAWEDCTTGNIFTAHCIRGEFPTDLVKTGVEVMMFLVDWYKANATGAGVGFFQIGGGTVEIMVHISGRGILKEYAKGAEDPDYLWTL